MGSFNDILPELVGELPDHRVERARQLRSQVWDLGDQIRRESEIDQAVQHGAGIVYRVIP